MKKFILLVVVVFALSGCFTTPPLPPPPENEPNGAETGGSGSTKETTVSLNIVDENGTDEAVEKEGEEIVEVEDKAPDAPRYVNYSGEIYDELKGGKPFVLFFHADWCPICRAMELNITEDIDSFPTGTIILKADYDKEKELKKEYGINIQSTVVVVNAGGETIYKATDPAFDDWKSAIEKSLEII